ncbi:MAG: protein kinase [Acidobacteria bacterium]|nr:protein kinase [Acidobacteriota bacterium]
MLMEPSNESFTGFVFDGKYELLHQLGSGGMGVVYLAQQCSTGKQVAVKIRHQESKAELDRFQREAQAASLMNHPHSVTILDYGITADGIYYIAMELLQGPSLSEELAAKGFFSFDRTLEFMRPVAQALSAAHALGLIHRDLKPSNVLLHRPSPGIEIVKVVDFGMAKMDQLDQSSAQLTGTGWVLGTPEYMSPEQCLGHTVDARTDIYSFGVMLFELLTGQLPFRDTTISNILLKQISEHPPYLRKFRPELPASLESFILRLLSKLPSSRPGTLSDVLAELEGIWKRWHQEAQSHTQSDAGSEGMAAGAGPTPPGPSVASLSSTNAPTLVATLLDVPTAWELDERETLSGCYLRTAFIRRFEDWLLKTSPVPPETPLGCLLVLELVGWEAWRTTAQIEEVEQALRDTGQILTRVFGGAALLGRYSESRWLVALPWPESPNLNAKSRIENFTHRSVLEFHRTVQRNPLLGMAARLVVSAGGVLFRRGEQAQPLITIALERLQRARKKERGTVILENEPTVLPAGKALEATFLKSLRTGPLPQLELSTETEFVGLLKEHRFVGRSTVIERLRSAFYQNLRDTAYPAWILGDPGSGKSYLLEQLGDQLALKDVFIRQVRFTQAEPDDGLSIFYEALRDLLKRLVEEDPDSLPATFGTLTDRVREDFLDQEAVSQVILNASGRDLPLLAETQKIEQFEYFTRVFGLIARCRPVILCVDDVHCAQPTGLEFVSYLLRRTGSERFFLILTLCRPEIERDGSLVKAWFRQIQRAFPGESISLADFTLHDVRRLVESMVWPSQVCEEAICRLMLETKGNPRYVKELVTLLHEENRLVYQADCWRLSSGTDVLPVPACVLRDAEALVAQMDPEAQDVLSMAAFIHERFAFDVLRELTQLPEGTLLEILEKAMDRQILVEDEEVQDGYRFSNPVVGRILAGRLDQEDRKDLHRRVCKLIEPYASGQAAWAFPLAEHSLKAGQWDAAFETALRAGRAILRKPHALAVLWSNQSYRTGQIALHHLEPASTRTLSPGTSSQETIQTYIRFHLEYAGVLQTLGIFEAATNQIAEAEALADTVGSSYVLALVALGRGRLYEDQGNLRLALDSGYQGLARFIQQEDLAGILMSLLLVAGIHTRLAHYARALEQCQQALRRAQEQSNTNAEAMALCGMGMTLHHQGCYGEALKRGHQALELSQRERGQREWVAARQARTLLGHLYLDMGIWTTAREFLQTALTSAQCGGYRLSEMHLLALMGRLHFELAVQQAHGKTQVNPITMSPEVAAELATATEYLDQAYRLAVHLNHPETQARTMLTRGYILAFKGKLGLALDIAQQVISLIREMERPALEVQAYIALGNIRFRLGQFAVGMYDRALTLAREIGHQRLMWQALRGLADIARSGGDLQQEKAYLLQASEILVQLQAGLPEELHQSAFARERNILQQVVPM